MSFSRDRDKNSCAKNWNGGWWFANCHRGHPTGHSTATKTYGGGKYVDYYAGGLRGNSKASWAEAEYLLVPN